jgi:hypothetical protein
LFQGVGSIWVRVGNSAVLVTASEMQIVKGTFGVNYPATSLKRQFEHDSGYGLLSLVMHQLKADEKRRLQKLAQLPQTSVGFAVS